MIAGAVGREVVVVEEDADGRGTEQVAALGLAAGDAVVLCDHDAPDGPRCSATRWPRRRRTSR